MTLTLAAPESQPVVWAVLVRLFPAAETPTTLVQATGSSARISLAKAALSTTAVERQRRAPLRRGARSISCPRVESWAFYDLARESFLTNRPIALNAKRRPPMILKIGNSATLCKTYFHFWPLVCEFLFYN